MSKELVESIQVMLSKSIDFHKDGQTASSNVVTLKAPSTKSRKQTAKIKQAFFRAMKSMQNSVSAEDIEKQRAAKLGAPTSEQEMSGHQILTMILMSDEDYEKFQENFADLFTSGNALLDDSVVLTKTIIENLTDADFDNLIAEYLENFTFGSLMST